MATTTRVAPADTPFTSTDSLNSALAQSPDVRPTEVARGKALASQVYWPPQDTIRRIAHLLALNVNRQED